jgi:glycosyltransferase involved in cell wall biosynthesis
MVTGAYFPELSGGGLQARAIVGALRDRVDFSVLTTSIDPSLPSRSADDGVPIRRIYVDVSSAASKLMAGVRFAWSLLRSAPFDIVNLHGFSRKAILLVAFSRLSGKRFILTLQTGLHDEPDTVRQAGRLAYWAYRGADLYLSVSPGLSQAYLRAGLPAERLRQVCNAVDTQRFRPAATPQERTSLRRELSLPEDAAVVLFVGFFSRDKRPVILFDAWADTADGHRSALVMVGATRSAYHEVDSSVADVIREQVAQRGLTSRVFLVEPTPAIDRYFRAADIYVLPSIREGLPIALLEAMASGAACIASRLPGSTDGIIEDGVNGILVGPDDRAGFSQALAALLDDPERRARLGAAARRTVVDRYSIDRTAPAWLSAYLETGTAR